MKLYNTLSRKIEEFSPAAPNLITMYSCGPTVYDNVHIGNLSSFIYADMLRRALSLDGQNVKHVMNFTDVDDKTIRRSNERYPDIDPKEALSKLTREYERIFLDDSDLIGNDQSSVDYIRATESIEAMRKLITELHEDGYAYLAEDGIYFSIEAYRKGGRKYGQLLNLSEASTSSARIDNDEYDKESLHDFALWKRRKQSEPAWDFEIDGEDMTGRPGWHIECSAMSVARLGQPFDIHTGGIDLVFPHHENEIAQSTAGKGELYAKHFFHNEHLLVDGKKMSKSLNNFHTLKDIRDKGYDPLAFRLMVLQSHYRSQANFTWESLEAAQNRLRNWRALADLRWQRDSKTLDLGKLKHELRNDLSTPQALFELEQALPAEDSLIGISDQSVSDIDTILGIDLSSADITDSQKQLLAQRQKARDDKDWAKSDAVRHELETQGINVRDTPQGQVWYRN